MAHTELWGQDLPERRAASQLSAWQPRMWLSGGCQLWSRVFVVLILGFDSCPHGCKEHDKATPPGGWQHPSHAIAASGTNEASAELCQWPTPSSSSLSHFPKPLGLALPTGVVQNPEQHPRSWAV